MQNDIPLTDSEVLATLLAKVNDLSSELAEVKAALSPMNSFRQRLSDIQRLVTAPRAVSTGDGLILAKLAFDDLMMVIDQRDRLIGPHLIMNGIYEKGLTAYFRSIIGEISTFVDVGANIGYYTCLFGKQLRERGRVFAFEPDAANFSLLQRNTQINWIDKRNIAIEQLALSDSIGTAKLYRNVQKPGNTSLLEPSAEEMRVQDLQPYEVPTTTLDAYFADKEPGIDLMKIDVEGHEFPILKGARATIQANPGLRLVLEWDPPRWARIGVKPDHVIEFLNDVSLSPAIVSSRGELTPLSNAELTHVPYANIVCQRSSDESNSSHA